LGLKFSNVPSKCVQFILDNSKGVKLDLQRSWAQDERKGIPEIETEVDLEEHILRIRLYSPSLEEEENDDEYDGYGHGHGYASHHFNL
jgi:hypothetical protein